MASWMSGWLVEQEEDIVDSVHLAILSSTTHPTPLTISFSNPSSIRFNPAIPFPQ